MKKVIFLSLIILFSIKTQNINAKKNTFVVENIVLNEEIANHKTNNRDKYLNIAFKKGFKNLVINLLRKEDQKKILSTDLKTIKSLIENYRILEELRLDNIYTLRLSLTFDKNKTKKFFYDQNIAYAETSELNTLLYPILVDENNLQIFSKNKFFEEWNENEDLENINFILPVENIEDINFIKQNLDFLEEIDLSKLVSNYEIENNSILIFRHNNNKLKVFLKTNLNGVKKNNKIEFTVEDLNNKDVRKELIKNLKFYINELWKEENLIDISAPASLTFITNLNKPEKLQLVLSKLTNINFIDSYKVLEFNKNTAKIKIIYLGKIKNIQDSLVKNGFKFEIKNNEWFLTL